MDLQNHLVVVLSAPTVSCHNPAAFTKCVNKANLCNMFADMPLGTHYGGIAVVAEGQHRYNLEHRYSLTWRTAHVQV